MLRDAIFSQHTHRQLPERETPSNSRGSLSFSSSPALSLVFLRSSSGSLWIQSIKLFGCSVFFWAVYLTSGAVFGIIRIASMWITFELWKALGRVGWPKLRWTYFKKRGLGPDVAAGPRAEIVFKYCGKASTWISFGLRTALARIWRPTPRPNLCSKC